MGEDRLLSYHRRWNSRVKVKLWIFQTFVEVKQSFQRTCSGTHELGAPKRLSLIFSQAEGFPTIIRYFCGYSASRFGRSFSDCCLLNTVFHLSLLSQSIWPLFLLDVADQCTAFHLNLPLCPQAKDFLAKDLTLLFCNTLGRAVCNCHELYSG